MNGHRFEIDLPDEPLAAEADPDKVRQVFHILVENALRYLARRAAPSRSARAAPTTASRSRVADQGIGIPAAERERIFGSSIGPSRPRGTARPAPGSASSSPRSS